MVTVPNDIQEFIMTTNRKKVMTYLDHEQADALKKLSEKTRVPTAAYIREAVDMLLKKYKVKK